MTRVAREVVERHVLQDVVGTVRRARQRACRAVRYRAGNLDDKPLQQSDLDRIERQNIVADSDSPRDGLRGDLLDNRLGVSEDRGTGNPVGNETDVARYTHMLAHLSLTQSFALTFDLKLMLTGALLCRCKFSSHKCHPYRLGAGWQR